MIHITILNTCVLQAGLGRGWQREEVCGFVCVSTVIAIKRLNRNSAHRFLTGAKSRFENRKNFFYRLKMAVVLRI